ncbi:MAG: hypothetical protein ACC641_02690 [Acidiferrobacterales bacterium]
MGNEEIRNFDDSGSRFRASGREAVKENVALAFESARRAIVIYSPLLDPAQFNQSRVIEAMATFCAGGRPNKVRILVGRGDETIRSNARVTSLARRFSDFIDLRQLGKGSGSPSDMFVVIDRNGYLHQPDSEKAECIVDFNASNEVGALSRRFEKMWERSEPIAGLHVTGL